MQQRFDHKPFGGRVAHHAVMCAVAVEDMESPVTVPGLGIARDAVAVAVEIQFDIARLLDGGEQFRRDIGDQAMQ